MLDRKLGGFISANPPAPSQASAQGVWDGNQQIVAQLQNAWPLPPNVVQRSLRFNSADIAYLNRTPSVTGDRKTYSHSFWVKRGTLGATKWAFSVRQSTTSGNFFYEGLFYSDDTFSVQLRDGSSSEVGNIRTTQVFRDPSAWYHFVVVIDTTQATSSNRMKLYVNGSQVTALGTATYPAQNFDTGANTLGYPFYIGNFVTTSPSSANNFDGYMAEVNFIDGQALTPSSFGETDPQTGIWVPKRYTGTYGTNGFRLPFSNNSSTTALGFDASGNGNNFTPNGLSVTPGSGNDSLLDVPSLYGATDTGVGGEVRGNYATFNPLSNPGNSTLSNGNLEVSTPNGTAGRVLSTIGVSSGKWYCEFTVTSVGAGFRTGIVKDGFNNGDIIGKFANEYAYYSDGNKYSNDTAATYGASYTTNDVIGVALDLDNGTLSFSKNGVSQGVAYTGITGTYMFGVCDITGASGISSIANFGQRPFAFPAPAGFKALCTTNFVAPAIGQTAANRAGNHFAAVTYQGNGSTQNVVTDFAPDLVWIKNRSSNWSNLLYDTLRGPSTGSTSKAISSNGTDAEGVINDNSTYGYLSAFNSNGFTVNAGSYVGSGGYANTSGQNYVAWCWNAGGNTVTNNAGSNGATIASTYRANRAAGFSIVRFTGSATNNTVGHGLGAAPAFIIVKAASEAGQSWRCYHQSLGLNSFITLDTTAAAESAAAYWGSSAFTANVFGLYAGGAAGNNRTGQTMIAYCFAAVPGFSAFGSYTGNGSADGPFVYLGFRPAFLLIKNTTAGTTGNWMIYDTKRNTLNLSGFKIAANSSAAENDASSLGDTTIGIDILSNGFKIRNTGNNHGFSGNVLIYAAFAEAPFRLSSAR